jgi:hypothetical protein
MDDSKATDAELIAGAIFDLSKSVRLLGMGNIDRFNESPGAVEELARLIRESNKGIAAALDGVADAIQELAGAVERSK